MNEEVAFHYEQANYSKAIIAAERLRELIEKYIGTDDPNYAACLSSLATLYGEIEDYSAAERLHRQALQIRRAALGDNHPDVALSLRNLAELHLTLRRYDTAQQFIHEALEIQLTTTGRDDPQYATDLTVLAGLHFALGQYTESERLNQEALQIRQSILGADHPPCAMSLYNLAELHRARGEYAEAERLLEKACRIYRVAVGEHHPDYANCLNSLGTLYGSIGNYAAAVSLLSEASSIWHRVYGKSDSRYALSLNNLADVYCRMERFSEAEPLYLQAIEISRDTLGAHHPDLAISLDNLGLMYLQTGEPDKAKPLQQEALEILRNDPDVDRTSLATCLNNMGLTHRALGDFEAAEQEYRQALEIDRGLLGGQHPSVAATLNNLASVYIATDRHQDALVLIEQAEAIEDQMIGQIFSIGSEQQRMTYLDQIRRSDQELMSLVAEHLYDSTTAVKCAHKRILKRKGVGAEALAVQRDAVLSGRHPLLKSKIEELSALRSQIAKETLFGATDEDVWEYQTRLADLEGRRASLEAELARTIPEMNLQRHFQFADCSVVARELPYDTSLVEFVRIEVLDFKASIDYDRSRWKPPRYLAFVLCAGNPDDVCMIDLGEAERIDQMIAMYRTSITGEREAGSGQGAEQLSIVPSDISVRSDPAALRSAIKVTRTLRPPGRVPRPERRLELGTRLRQVLFDPLRRTTEGRKRLFLSPDGDLARLPFETLPMDEGGCLIDEYQISYLSVGRDILRFGVTSSAQAAKALVIADPDFDFSSLDGPRVTPNTPFTRLNGTHQEGEKVAALLDVEPIMRSQALEREIKACQSPCVLHVASHGFFLPDAPRGASSEMPGLATVRGLTDSRLAWLARVANPLLRSALALAGANTWLQEAKLPPEAEDGILTAEDVSGLDLLATELVVLSACETGLGEVQVGEGVFGLRRSFMLAGAKTLVMSLWKVPDPQTQELMVDFYERILAGQPRAEALRNAQLAMKEKYPDPLYWGAFICQGDPGPLVLATA